MMTSEKPRVPNLALHRPPLSKSRSIATLKMGDSIYEMEKEEIIIGKSIMKILNVSWKFIY